jgi:hypothetical protein
MISKPIKTLISGSLLLAMGAAPIFAFSSMTAKEIAIYLATGKPGGYIHRQITEEALTPLQMKKDIIDKIGDWIWRTDWDESKKSLPPRPNENYQPAHHFDRNELANCEGCETKHAEAFLRGAQYAAEEKAIAIAGLKKEQGKTLDDAIEAIGHGLHALQDVFSHSNIVDLPADDLEAVKEALKNAAAPPKTLKLSGYDLKKGKDLQDVPGSECLETYDFGHEACSKDEPKKNKESQKKIQTTAAAYDKKRPDRTKFDGAMELAVEFSRAWVEQIRDEAGTKAWQQFFDSGKAASVRIQMKSLALFLDPQGQDFIVNFYEQLARYRVFEENTSG